ncbi:hypothetical protein [Oceaniglobus roseus]|nr:hypothetical protein [Kandeliimicrobium roseum]
MPKLGFETTIEDRRRKADTVVPLNRRIGEMAQRPSLHGTSRTGET